jgi:hypothetical protein
MKRTVVAILLASALWARAGKVEITAEGALLVESNRVFPIGFTMPPPPDGKAPSGRHAYDEIRDAGATFIRTGPTAGVWDDAAIQTELKFQDAATGHGLRCMVYLRELASIGPGQEKREAGLAKVVAALKDHPGMGVWKGADEPQWGKLAVPPLVHVRERLKELDPNHPVWIVQAPRGTVESMRAYDATYDITGMDVYPIGYPPGAHSLLENKEISMVGDYTKMMRDVAGRKPVWMTLQIAWSGVVKPGKTLRMPTFPQERFMAYQAIINGARGLVFFGGNIPAAWTKEDAALGWNWSFWQRVLRPVVAEIGDHGPLAAALVAPESKLPVKVSGADDVEFCVRETDDAVFVLVCKREGKTVQVQFSGLPESLTRGEVLFEEPREVTAEKGTFKDWFAPFDVHVYRFHRN